MYYGKINKDEELLRDAYIQWRAKKSIENFRRILKDGFSGGFLVWRIWRVIRNTWINGRYEELYKERWSKCITEK